MAGRTMKVPGQRGRKPTTPQVGQRATLTLRVTPETKAALNAAAALSGRNLSQEAEYRLQATFDDERAMGRLMEAFRRHGFYPAEDGGTVWW